MGFKVSEFTPVGSIVGKLTLRLNWFITEDREMGQLDLIGGFEGDRPTEYQTSEYLGVKWIGTLLLLPTLDQQATERVSSTLNP
jgi:hypothetical protein